VLKKLSVAPLSSAETELFRELYEHFVRPYYAADTNDYAQTILESHFSALDPYGYLTKRRTIWVLSYNNKPIGVSVATEKRGGSVKFGPSALIADLRGRGLSPTCRLLLESQYPSARKFYNTLPEPNAVALRYVLSAGYEIEARLREQYGAHDELVVGKLRPLAPPRPPCIPELASNKGGALALVDARELPESLFVTSVRALLQPHYRGLDDAFFSGLLASLHSPPTFATKYKKLLVAMCGGHARGLMIATPKRGGALKLSPLVIPDDDPFVARLLLTAGLDRVDAPKQRRVYAHVAPDQKSLLAGLQTLGLTYEGTLREPYRAGVDLLAIGGCL